MNTLRSLALVVALASLGVILSPFIDQILNGDMTLGEMFSIAISSTWFVVSMIVFIGLFIIEFIGRLVIGLILSVILFIIVWNVKDHLFDQFDIGSSARNTLTSCVEQLVPDAENVSVDVDKIKDGVGSIDANVVKDGATRLVEYRVERDDDGSTYLVDPSTGDRLKGC